MNTTPEPWEEQNKSFLMYANPDDRDMLEGALDALVSQIRTAAYEQGKREGFNEGMVAVRCQTAENARKDLLTALKAVLGEKNTNVIPSKKRTFIKNYFEDTSEAYNGGWNDCTYEIEGTLNDIFTHFIKEQEDNQDKYE